MAFAFIFMVCVFAVIIVSVGKGKSAQVKVEKLEFPDEGTQAPQEGASAQEYESVSVSGPVEAYGPEPEPQAGQEVPVRPIADTAAGPAAKAPVKPSSAGKDTEPAIDLGNDEEKRKLIIYSEILKPKFDR